MNAEIRMVLVFTLIVAVFLAGKYTGERAAVAKNDDSNRQEIARHNLGQSGGDERVVQAQSAQNSTSPAAEKPSQTATGACVDQSVNCESNESIVNSGSDSELLEAIALEAIVANPNTSTFEIVTEQQRIDAYSSFDQQPYDPDWSAETQARIQKAVETAEQFDLGVKPELVDCRSETCLLRFRVDPADVDSDEAMVSAITFLGLSGIVATAKAQQTDVFSDIYLSNFQ
ncbi:MAG: hypothetical protein AAGF46_00195 [Pseudomonadota bacterium]